MVKIKSEISYLTLSDAISVIRSIRMNGEIDAFGKCIISINVSSNGTVNGLKAGCLTWYWK